MLMYQIKSDFNNPAFRPYGGCEAFFMSTAAEVIAVGPTNTGKTLAACWKLHMLASKYAGAQILIVRKTQKSLYSSVLQTFARVIKDAPVRSYGGDKPDKYVYSNGSQIWVGGLDNPDKVLSSERDVIYVNQAEEITENDWEVLITRATGRNAVVRFPQLMGDCNPSGSKHWIKLRAQAGRMSLIPTYHRDNPTLFDPVTGKITPLGIETFNRLENLTGVRRKRLLDGIWATAEGAVYDTFDAAVHVRERDPGEFVQWYMAMDEGYTNPAVILLIGEDSDKRLHIAREYYRRGVLQRDVVKSALEWAQELYQDSVERLRALGYSENDALARAPMVSRVCVDAAAAGLIADLRDVGLPAKGGKGRVKDGIDAVQALLKVAGDGRPRLTVDPSCVNVTNEFESYVWKPEKDEPVKETDHAMDALRYLVETLTKGSGDLIAWV